MKAVLIFALVVMGFNTYGQNAHHDAGRNFTVQRLIILNENGEMLMTREKHVWAVPSLIYDQRQYQKEALDSLASAYGLKIKNVRLHGQFAYKYDYRPNATMRDYFVADYGEGDAKVPEGMDDTKWVPIDEAIDLNTVVSIRQITEQIIKFPDVVWGGSFMVSHVGDDHPTKMVEPFYILFE